MNYSWEDTRAQVRQFRTTLQSIYPVQVLAVAKSFLIHNNVLYFLSNNKDSSDWCPTRYMQLYQISLDQRHHYTIPDNEKNYLTAISNIPILERSLVFTDCIALAENDSDKSASYRQMQIPGASAFEIKDDTLMFTFHNDIYIGQLGKVRVL